ncbi:MAG: NADH-quinone oxidoreductase subunit M [Candidatus Eisenbacteria bacterium]
MNSILSVLVFLPLFGAILVGLVPGSSIRTVRALTLFLTVILFLAALPLAFQFQGEGPMEFEQDIPWIPALGISYHVGVDGISFYLILLTAFLAPLVYLSTWNAVKTRVKEFSIWYLLLHTGMMGAFVALDLFLFYLFWELMLIPMAFLIGVWGGERRIYAAVKFVLYTVVGSLLMLVAILVLVKQASGVNGFVSFDWTDLVGVAVPPGMQILLFAAFALAFAIKVPLFPFHTWLPDAHVEAPTAGSAILAGILLKMGTYGFLRFAMPLFPEAARTAAPVLSLLAVIGIIYGALVAMVQDDVKKLVAYSSVSHLGFVVLGLFAFNVAGIEGGIYVMLAHGLSTSALFLLVGVLYERRHTRKIADYGGLARTMPLFATVFLITTLASIGLPTLSGFVGEFLVLFGTFRVSPVHAAFAATGVVFGAVYMLWMYRRVFFGPVTNDANRKLPDLSLRELVVIVPLLAGMVWLGVRPSPLLDKMEAAVKAHIRMMTPRDRAEAPRAEGGFAAFTSPRTAADGEEGKLR